MDLVMELLTGKDNENSTVLVNITLLSQCLANNNKLIVSIVIDFIRSNAVLL